MNLGAFMRKAKQGFAPWPALKAAANWIPTGSLHLFILFNLAIAQPLFDLLARSAPFFVAERSQPIDIILLVLLLCVLLPASCLFVEIVASLISERLRSGIHTVLVATLLTVIALTILKPLAPVPGIALALGAGLLGIMGVVAYLRFNPVRQFFTFASIGVFVIPVAFLLDSDITKIVFPDVSARSIEVEVTSTTPVVMVIFDELPLTSLMDEKREIDPIRYPNFARLAKDAQWFRNATTVTDYTVQAVPAILTGQIPREIRVPTLEDHPNNLFTLLGDSYEMRVFESVTSLCPDVYCSETDRTPALADRMVSMLVDVGVIYLHIVIPNDANWGLPPITRAWHDFVETPAAMNQQSSSRSDGEPQWQDRAEFFAAFVRSIENSDVSRLYFMHIEIPHPPWKYLPNGKSIVSVVPASHVDGLDPPGRFEVWTNDDWLTIQGFQRHLLQVGFADKLLGDLMVRLKSVGMYERSLVIVVADHGASFRVGVNRRLLNNHNLHDLLPVPLFVKLPHQDRGEISDRNVQIVDILPTIAEVLGVRLPWRVDGRSLLDTSIPDRTELTVFGHDPQRLIIAPIGEEMYESLTRKLAVFGSGTKVDGLYRIGRYSQIIGQDLGAYVVGQAADVRIWIDDGHLWEDIDPDSEEVPARITGQVFTSADVTQDLHLAVAVNGTIQAVTRSFVRSNDIAFSAIVPQRFFRRGFNQVELFIVSGPTDRPRLRAPANAQAETSNYSLSKLDGREVIEAPDGQIVPIVPGAIGGNVERGIQQGDEAIIEGWAADLRGSQPAESILVVVNGAVVHLWQPHRARPDVASHFGNPDLEKSGFVLVFASERLGDPENTEVRIVALSSYGVASELTYGDGYPWRTRPAHPRPIQFQSSDIEEGPHYSLRSDGGSNMIASSDGRMLPIVTDVIAGTLDTWFVDGDLVFVNGWAVDDRGSQAVETVLLFANGQFLSARETNFARPDIARALGNDALLESGFDFVIASERLGNLDETEMRVFAVTKNGEAQELAYYSGFPWARMSNDSVE